MRLSGYNLKWAISSLIGSPTHTIIVSLILGVTLGTLVAMFNLNHLFFVKPLPYEDQERLYKAEWTLLVDGEPAYWNMQTYPGLMKLYQNEQGFESKALIQYREELLLNKPDKPRLTVAYSTPEFVQLSNMKVMMGRSFSENEGLNSYKPVALLDRDTWRTEFRSNPNILGEKVTIGEVSYEIIGVIDQGYVEPKLLDSGRTTQLWLPWDFNDTSDSVRRDWSGFDKETFFVGKVEEGANVASISRDMSNAINKIFKEETASIGFFKNMNISIELLPFSRIIMGDIGKLSLMLFGAALVLTLIASVNIINLLLSKAVKNKQRIAIKATLGAQKGHIFSYIFSEIIILMLLSSFISMMIASYGYELLKLYAQDKIPRVDELSLSLESVVFSLSVATILAISFSLIIVHQIKYKFLSAELQGSGKGAGIQVSKKVRNIMIACQIGFSFALLVINIQVFNQAMNTVDTPLGFKTDNMAHLLISPGTLQLSPEERQQYSFMIKDKLLKEPYIEAVSIANTAPLPNLSGEWISGLTTDKAATKRFGPTTNRIDHNYFTMIDLPVLKGRNFTEEEHRLGARVIIVNETLAKAMEPDQEVLNKYFYWSNQDDPYKVIGIVKDTQVPHKNHTQRLYLTGVGSPNFMLQLKNGVTLSKARVNQLLEEVNPQLSIYEVLDFTEARERILVNDISLAWITFSLTLLSIALAGIGIYGVLSYGITLRRYELGIRMAIGATPLKIITLILLESSKIMLIGILIGGLISTGIYYLAHQYQFVVLSFDIISILVPLLIIVLTTYLSCLASSWRLAFKFPRHSLSS